MARHCGDGKEEMGVSHGTGMGTLYFPSPGMERAVAALGCLGRSLKESSEENLNLSWLQLGAGPRLLLLARMEREVGELPAAQKLHWYLGKAAPAPSKCQPWPCAPLSRAHTYRWAR